MSATPATPAAPSRGWQRFRRRVWNAADWLGWIWRNRSPSARLRDRHAHTVRHRMAPPMEVETTAAPGDMARLVARIEASWTAFGETDPHWSVLTQPAYRRDRIAATAPEFYRTGDKMVDRLAAMFARAGADFAAVRDVIDYGCGVGRVSAALARRGRRVTGVDISAPHLAAAREHATGAGLDAGFVHLARLADIDALPETDLFLSVIVLQHNPPPVMAEILRRGLARVRPGGFAWLQLPTYMRGYRYRVADDLAAAPGTMEFHVLPQPALFDLLDRAGFVPLEIRIDDAVAQPEAESHAVLARRRRNIPSPEEPVHG